MLPCHGRRSESESHHSLWYLRRRLKMNNGNKKKDLQLGMPHGTANSKLRKALLFKYVVSCNDNTCFRCGKVIDDINNFSIDHKIAWLDSLDPVGLFFSMDNIAFSHLDCNCSAGKKPQTQPINHGIQNGYKKGCRCPDCYNAQVIHNRNSRGYYD